MRHLPANFDTLMATTLSEALFWLAVAAIAIAQFLILRSTRRGMRRGPAGSGSLLEWGYAVLPGIALALTLAWTWRTMHVVTIQLDAPPPAAAVRS
jgi:hypothetical protein